LPRLLHLLAAAAAIVTALGAGDPANAQKRGGILRMYDPDSPPTMSLLEEATIGSQAPMMGVFNNLVMFDQHVKQTSLQSIVPDLATSWSWSEDGTALTMPLRQGVRWHDGKPFTAADVKCTWDLIMETGSDKLRFNPRKSQYKNLDRVSVNGDYEVTFHLKHPQPAFPIVLAGGFSAIYPCHVPAAQMRQHPIGTGPFKFVEFKQNESIKVTRNPDYWKPGLPYLDGIEYTIIKDPSTAVLAFIAGKFDMTFPYFLRIPQLKDVQSQSPQAICEVTPAGGVNNHLLVNRDTPPFDNLELRRAMALAIDRKAFIDILNEGQGDIGGVLQPPPGGQWGMPPETLRTLPGYDPDIEKNRVEGRQIMQKLGYGPSNPLKIKLSTRDLTIYRDPAVIMLDQLKQVYIDAELELIDTSRYFPKIMRKEFTVSVNLQTSGAEAIDLFYGCGSSLNWDGYCNADVDRLLVEQSEASDEERRKQLLWAIERKLAEDFARPIISYGRIATCWQPHVKNLTMMVNSVFSGNRREDTWLDK
jgi:peptide/nickel transport system substrate-binding protein